MVVARCATQAVVSVHILASEDNRAGGRWPFFIREFLKMVGLISRSRLAGLLRVRPRGLEISAAPRRFVEPLKKPPGQLGGFFFMPGDW
jgi:hypothetical protein